MLPVGRTRRAPITLTTDDGAAPGGFTDPMLPGHGLCEVCHRRTEVFRADGRGAPHFTQSCPLCHEHTTGFRPVATEANCAFCHAEPAARLAKPSAHQERFTCSGCHTEVAAEPGPDHRATSACAECHTTATHAPAGSCTTCHDPHGTDNARLVLDVLATPAGPRPVRFTGDLIGRADGSFASASAPGSGICEVCHTTTRFYRADGSGEAHFSLSCLPCHRHEAGFSPR
jgi:hypothetical protein